MNSRMVMTSFSETIMKRRSVRSFLDKPVERWKIQKILKTLMLAPSAANLQSYKVFVVSNTKKKEKLVSAAHNQEYVKAGIVLIFCTYPKRAKRRFGRRGEVLFSLQDATIAAAYSQLVATSLGLSSIWIGRFSEQKVQKMIKTKLRPVAIIPVGYSQERPKPKKIRKFTEIVRKI